MEEASGAVGNIFLFCVIVYLNDNKSVKMFEFLILF